MARVKICGIRTPDDLHAVQLAGADWTGLVFASPSPRHLSLNEAAAIRDAADAINKVKAPLLVALVVDAVDAMLDGIAAAMRPDVIQCHGNESPARLAAIKSRYGCAVMKAIRVQSAESIIDAKKYDGIADILLFDSASQDAALPGGTGRSFDWGLMKAYHGKTPWMLAGGLTPENVAEAIRISGANAVDVSSGVESVRGQKDHPAIRRFISTAL